LEKKEVVINILFIIYFDVNIFNFTIFINRLDKKNKLTKINQKSGIVSKKHFRITLLLIF